MKTPTRYVLGFMFDPSLEAVVLIQKAKPAWQAGLFNGTGGHIEGDESPNVAMAREHLEECGVETKPEEWSHYGTMGDGEFFQVELLTMRTERAFEARTVTKEKVQIFGNGFPIMWEKCIENLHWLIELAKDHLQDGRPSFTTIHYPKAPCKENP